MSKSLKVAILVSIIGATTLGFTQLGTRGVQQIGSLPIINPLNCGETKLLVRNNTDQDKTFYVEIRDCCTNFDSILFINDVNNRVHYVPDQGAICTSVTLEPGDKLYLDCNGTGNGDCTAVFLDNCNNCP